MVPREPCQPRTVWADARRGVEVVSRRQYVSRAALGDIERDDGVDRLTTGHGVVLADADQAAARTVDDAVGVPEAELGRERVGRAAWSLPVQALVGEVAEVDHSVRDRIGAAAVLVYASADVERGRGHVRGPPVRGPPDDYGPRSLLRAHLGPVDVVAVDGRLAEPDEGGRDEAGPDRRPPGPVWGYVGYGHWVLSRWILLGAGARVNARPAPVTSRAAPTSRT